MTTTRRQTFDWQGASGKWYTYTVYPIDTHGPMCPAITYSPNKSGMDACPCTLARRAALRIAYLVTRSGRAFDATV